MHPRRCVVSLSIMLLAASSLVLAQAAPQDSSGPTLFKASAQNVIVEVVVTGKNGKPVLGLHKEDFSAAEDGHAEDIRFFEEHAGTTAVPAKLPALPVNVFTNIPRMPPTDSVTVLLLDALNTPLESQSFVRTQMLKYLKTLQPGRRMAIFALGNKLSFIQGFTDDPALLVAALKNPKSGTTPQSSSVLQSHGELAADQQAIALMAEHAAAGAQVLKRFQAEQSGAQTSLRATMTLNAFQQLAGYLAGIPGRKNLVWFSSAFPVVLFPNADQADSFATQRDLGEAVSTTDRLLTSAQVSIYPLAAEGLATDAINNADQQFGAVVAQQMGAQPTPDHLGQSVPQGQQAQEEQHNALQSDATQRNANHAGMDEIAHATGGEAIYNTNGLDDALARVQELGSHYYTLAYSPTNTSNDGQFRKIQVKLASSGYKLAYRRGYYANPANAPGTTAVALTNLPARPAASTAQPADPMLRYMLPGLPDSTEIALGLRIQPATLDPARAAEARTGDNAQLKGATTRYVVYFLLTAHSLRLVPTTDGGRAGKIEATVVVYGAEGKALNWIVRQLDLTMDAARYKTVLSSGINFTLTLDAPREAATLRSGVYDLNAQRAGTLEVPVGSIVQTAEKAATTP